MYPQPPAQAGIPPPPPPYPRPSRTGLKVAAVIVVVAVVIIALLAAALIAGWFGGKPTVSFSSMTAGGLGQNRTASWSVASVSQQNSFSSYKVAMDKDYTALGAAQTLAAYSVLSFGSGVSLVVADIDANGKLSAGDTFLVYGMPSGHAWTLRLLWNDGSWIRSAVWGGMSSLMLYISVMNTGSNWTLLIAYMQGSVAYADVFLTISDNNGSNVPPMISVSLADLTPANWGTYHVVFQNTGGGPELIEGSSILVEMATYPAGYHYEFVANSAVVSAGTFR